ncbi:MAG: type II secretion system GspH family protein [Defluviitaleaceae bacterium]|nr:type II secretion system GspH family protein [Defluviitaleaceae bacterium]
MKIKKALNNKGMTLIELIVSMLVFSIIMIAATAIFIPIYRAFERANTFAEANTLLDNIATVIMYDIANATEIIPHLGTIPSDTDDERLRIITGTQNFVFDVESEGLTLRTPTPESPPSILFERDFFRNKNLEIKWEVTGDLVEIEIILTGVDGNPMAFRRTYTARPLGLPF